MSMADDARFWNRSARKYAKGRISDEAGYARTLERTRALLKPDDNILELGCGTGTTAIRLAASVKDYLATDISADMIAIAKERQQAAGSLHNLTFSTTTAEALVPGDRQFNAVLGFNYLHLVRDLPGTLRHIHALLAPHGLLITKTPCVGDMNPLIRLVLPAMRAIGKAPYAGVFNAAELGRHINAGGFDILATEIHATKGNDNRPYIVARKR
ncbi:MULTISPECIES: bifunctional 2-polyprenyl-6-hydroxyphenol methylase/3-demethylubiquinol 3-O-methyltransferase UbiG [Rhizobium/Agrobacterium group]|uniref:Class I SAM-dependent methyltransferase n=1 Tax=Rhizobium rhizogenes TaxID=359 RepID=A0A546XBU2_RHIRH|nr:MULTISPECIES: class I SAM-dependent methyltransferase [Rhizobium/Agrobacterium group]TRA98213.1 class I SAM-dependent methyltransferase [Rhizobium rhizogenes]